MHTEPCNESMPRLQIQNVYVIMCDPSIGGQVVATDSAFTCLSIPAAPLKDIQVDPRLCRS
jgi:hypothetical protein